MRVKEHRMKQEGGHGWTTFRYGLTFYPTLRSRFQRFSESTRYDEWFMLKTTDRAQPMWAPNTILSLSKRSCLDTLHLEQGGPEVIAWLRENATGRVHLYVFYEIMTEMWSGSFDTRYEKRVEIAFARATDAVKFKLMFN
jgi:hypothetical protein